MEESLPQYLEPLGIQFFYCGFGDTKGVIDAAVPSELLYRRWTRMGMRRQDYNSDVQPDPSPRHRFLRFAITPPLSRKETTGLLLVGGVILLVILLRYGRFIPWDVW